MCGMQAMFIVGEKSIDSIGETKITFVAENLPYQCFYSWFFCNFYKNKYQASVSEQPL